MKSLICALSAFFLFCAAPESRAQNKLVEEYSAAHAEFKQMLLAKRARHEESSGAAVPRLSEPAVAPLLATLSDSGRFLDGQQYQPDELLKICGMVAEVTFEYVRSGSEKADVKAGPSEVLHQMLQAADDVIRAHQDELELLQPFMIRCVGAEIPFFNGLVSRLELEPEQQTESRIAGIRKVRIVALGFIDGAIRAAGDTSFKESYRMQILRAVADEAARLVIPLYIQDRRQLQRQAVSMQRENMPYAMKGYLEVIAKAMSNPDCTGFCNY